MRCPFRSAAFTCILVTLYATAVVPSVRAQSEFGPVPVEPGAGASPGAIPSTSTGDLTGHTGKAGIAPLVAPVPFRTTQLGWGLALMLGAIHRFDADTTVKPSTGAVGGWYAENESWGWAVGEMARLKHDTWRLRGIFTYADVNYDFYGIGEDAGNANQSIGIKQTLYLGAGTVGRRIKGGLYCGVMGLWMSTEVDLQDKPEPILPPPLADKLKELLADRIADLKTTTLVAPGLMTEYDTRNDDYWPTRGSWVKANALFFIESMGGEQEFQRYMLTWSWYKQLHGERVLLATNINAAVAAGDVPFYALPSVGMGQFGMRGYTQGRYRDKLMTTAQAELRFHAKGRFGATVFGGLGEVAPDASGLLDALVLPAIGLGVRYQLIKSYLMHVRADYAWGRDERLLYFSVSEAF